MFAHNFPFDPTYGYTELDLLSVGLPESPLDFAAFWTETFRANASIALNTHVVQSDSAHPGFDLSIAEFDTLGGYRIGAWIAYPKSGDIESAIVISQGYGGRSAPDFSQIPQGLAAIFPCAPGFGLSAHPDLPDDKMGHVIHRIDDRDAYLIRPCVTSIWSATTLLLELFPDAIGRIYFRGASFGGGIGALALPWDDRLTKAHLKVPTFGNHPIRNVCPCEGSGKAAAEHVAANPCASSVLAYYDAATAASYIRIPVHGAPALFDPKVPPPGQFAVTNALPNTAQIRILKAGHFEYPGQQEENAALNDDLAAWFSD